MNSPIEIPNYSVTVKKKKDVYYLSIPELHLFASGEVLADVYDALSKKKEDTFSLARDSDSLDELPEPAGVKPKTSWLPDLAPFTAKVAVIAGIFGIVLFVMSIQLKSTVGPYATRFDIMADRLTVSLNRVTKVVALVTGTESRIDNEALAGEFKGIANTFIKVADSIGELTPERQRKLALSMRRMVVALKPIIDEAKPLIDVRDRAGICQQGSNDPSCLTQNKDR